MKSIAAFCEAGVGGAERVFMGYCGELARRGWGVRVIVGGKLDAVTKGTWRDWGPGLEFFELPWRPRTGYRLPFILPSLDRGNIEPLRRKLLEFEPDLFLVNQPGPENALPAVEAALQLRPRPSVMTFVHLAAPHLMRMKLRRIRTWWVRRTLSRVDAVVSCSGATTQGLVDSYGLPSGRVRTVWNGIRRPGPRSAEERAIIRSELGLEAGDVAVLWAGRFTVEKGVDVLLSAAERTDAPLAFVLAGDGPLLPKLALRYEGLVKGGRVKLLGWRSDVNALIDACDIAIMPSRIESFGLFVVEAMAADKPVVASNVCGIPEVVVDGETGILVPPENPIALAAALGRLAFDAPLRAAMGHAGRNRYKDLFTFEKAADRFELALLASIKT